MDGFYDSERSGFNVLDPRKEWIASFHQWVIQQRETRSLRAMNLRRFQRESLPMARASLNREGCEEIVSGFAEVCVELVQIEADLELLDAVYLVAANHETHDLLDLSSPSMRLLWDWFVRESEVSAHA